MLLAFEKIVKPRTGTHVPPRREESAEILNITVVFTSVNSTKAALKKAGALASSLSARITLLVPQVVPFPLPLESPPVLLDWNERRFIDIAVDSPVETFVRLYLCRDKVETLKSVLSPKSVVVMGGRGGWWPFTNEKRLAAQLHRAGHEVILTEAE